jgi:hypothetical protein
MRFLRKPTMDDITSTFMYHGRRVHNIPLWSSIQLCLFNPHKYDPPSPLDIQNLQEGDLVKVGRPNAILWLSVQEHVGWDLQVVCKPFKYVLYDNEFQFSPEDYFLIHYHHILAIKRSKKSAIVRNLRQWLDNHPYVIEEEIIAESLQTSRVD